MRLLFGIVLGVALTVGVAFISDNWGPGPSTTNGSGSAVVEHRNMVNWDIVGERLQIARQRVQETWTKVSHKIAS
jgi:hypothetical protein